MLDLGWTELLVIGVVALIVVGPKDLPILFRKAGEFVGRMKGMAREFSRAMNDAADESGMRETADSLRKMADPKQMGIDGVKDAVNDLKKWEPDSETAGLAAESEEKRKKMVEEANASAVETAREVREAHAAREAKDADKGEGTGKTAAKKPAASKPAAKKTASKKPASKPATKKSASDKPASDKTAKEKPAAKKAAPKKTGATSKSASKPARSKASAAKTSAPKTSAPKASAPKAAAKKPAGSKPATGKAAAKPAAKGSSKDTS